MGEYIVYKVQEDIFFEAPSCQIVWPDHFGVSGHHPANYTATTTDTYTVTLSLFSTFLQAPGSVPLVLLASVTVLYFPPEEEVSTVRYS